MAQQYVFNEDRNCDESNTLVDWKLCILCQHVTDEVLQFPSHTKRTDKGAGYKYVAENIRKFHELDALPFQINLHHIDNGSGIEATLHENNAGWHKTCPNRICTMKLEREMKRKSTKENETMVKTRRISRDVSQNRENQDVCIICNKEAGAEGLHLALTFDINYRVRECAQKLNDPDLLARLSGGDMVALEAKYHTTCLIKLCRKAQSVEAERENDSTTEKNLHAIALAELVSHIESFRDDTVHPVLNMTEVKSLYISRLCELGVQDVKVHTTRLRIRLLAAIPDLRTYNDGKQTFLVFDEDIGGALKCVWEQNFDSEALILAKAAKIISRDVFSKKQTFTGHFTMDCQKQSIPTSLNT